MPPATLHEPDRVPMQDLLRAHDLEYVERVEQGTLTAAEQRVLGLPWSEALAERSFRTTGATLEAARFALTNGLAMNLAGGTHHAFASHGEGFCVFNDVAVAVRSLRANGLARRDLTQRSVRLAVPELGDPWNMIHLCAWAS